MTNPTQPTPEQLAKWSEEFLVKQPANYTRDNPRFIHDAELKGYLRAKQENEQALKDARKQTLEEVLAISNSAARNYCNHGYFELKQAIKELLNEQ